MNRYQFRIWDNEVQEWIYFGFETYDEQKEKIKKALTSGEVVCQCSGKTDKKGKYIYEGDIVRVSDRVLDEIIFAEGCFCLANAMMQYEATYWGSNMLEVVGDIHSTQK